MFRFVGSLVDVALRGAKVRPRLPRGFPLVDGADELDSLRLEKPAGTLERTRTLKIDLTFACPSIPIYLKPPDLAETPRARLVSGARSECTGRKDHGHNQGRGIRKSGARARWVRGG